jgi:membrane-anchored protein YejM (alkaline phosphatase superfamily)
MPKTGIVESDKMAVARHWLGKHVPMATIEFLDMLFSMWSISYQRKIDG